MSNNINDIFAAEGLTTEAVTNAVGLVKLEGSDKTKTEGSFVLSGQKLAIDKGFKNVSHIWYDKTLSYEQGLEQLEAERAKSLDIAATVNEMIPTVDTNGQFAFLYRPTETYYRPTEHAMGQIGNWAATGTWTPINLMQPITDYKGRVIEQRDKADAECLAHLIRNGFRRLEKDKKFFFRCRVDGTMRAMLTDRYATIDNRWFVEKLSSFVPGGRLSHWRGDADTLWGNILIPDTIREDSDSEYGGMLSVGNSEIGERRVSSMPSIFRAICMNGCIWGQTKGKGIKQVHRGKVNLDSLALEIKENLNIQIPLLPQGIDRLLNTRIYAWDGASAKAVIAQVSKDSKFNKKQANDVLAGWNLEKKLTPEFGETLFGIINGITRAGQNQPNAQWIDFDMIGGEMTDWSEDDFQRTVKRAKGLSVKEVEEVYA